VRARLISAVLIGGDVRVQAAGASLAPVCDDVFSDESCVSLRALPLCAGPTDLGCVVAYSSYREEAPPVATVGLFGRGGPLTRVACVNPRRGASGPYHGSYAPVHFANPLFAPSNATLPGDLTTPFALARDVFEGRCVSSVEGGVPFDYLSIAWRHPDGDQRPQPPYFSPLQETLGFGLHLADYNLPQDDLIEWVADQAATYLTSR